jgi:predicted GNAT family acetyltransferase
MNSIIHHSHKQCFTLSVDGAEAIVEYRLLDNNTINFSRTFVPTELRGHGVAEKLVRTALSWAKEKGFTIHASCWYVNKFLR